MYLGSKVPDAYILRNYIVLLYDLTHPSPEIGSAAEMLVTPGRALFMDEISTGYLTARQPSR